VTVLWILYGLTALLGIVWPVSVLVADTRISPDQVTRALADITQAPWILGMFAGGPGRMVDAIVTDLVDRGFVTAQDGALATREGLGNPTMADGVVMAAVAEAGAEGIFEVRRRVAMGGFVFRMAFTRLSDRRLLVSALRRRWEPAGRALAVLGVLAVVTFLMMGLGDFGSSSYETSAALAVVGWVPFTLATALVSARRRGYFGPDPRTALGMACLRTLTPETPAAQVALHGFDSLASAAAIKGRDQESTWESRPKRKDAYGIDEAAWKLVLPDVS
jgi:uncharacterized protein (TIGR04222 family)